MFWFWIIFIVWLFFWIFEKREYRKKNIAAQQDLWREHLPHDETIPNWDSIQNLQKERQFWYSILDELDGKNVDSPKRIDRFSESEKVQLRQRGDAALRQINARLETLLTANAILDTRING